MLGFHLLMLASSPSPSLCDHLLQSASSSFDFNKICESGIRCGSESVLSSKILIAGGTVVNVDHQEVAYVYVEDGVIVDVTPNIKVSDGVRIVDATGKFVMPVAYLKE